MTPNQKVLQYFLIVIGIFLFLNLIRSIVSISQKGHIIEDTQSRLLAEEERNSKLTRELAKVESPEYIEQQVRDKLNLGRPGEYMVILPPMTPAPTPEAEVKEPVWERWKELFWY